MDNKVKLEQSEIITLASDFEQRVKESGTKRWAATMAIRNVMWTIVIRGSRIFKRCVDIVGALCLLILSSPFLIITSLAIKLEDRGPVLYKQVRIGLNGKKFYIWKFRSMVQNADKMKVDLQDDNITGGATFKIKKDPRITRTGVFIRKLSIDELPQFYNVLRGEMSLVGPRPPIPSEVDQYTPAQRQRLNIIPGITCLWQVGGRSDIDFEGQVGLDLQYIHSQSILQDLVILAKTVPAVLLGRGAY